MSTSDASVPHEIYFHDGMKIIVEASYPEVQEVAGFPHIQMCDEEDNVVALIAAQQVRWVRRLLPPVIVAPPSPTEDE